MASQDPVLALIEDFRTAQEAFDRLLAAHVDGDWSVSAGELTWTVREVAVHLADVCDFYGAHLASAGVRRLRFDTTLPSDASNHDVRETVAAKANVLGLVLAGVARDARCWHFHAISDVSGVAAMACDEFLVHGWDVAVGLGVGFQPDRQSCHRVLDRLFPWVDRDGDPWDLLLWSNGRIGLPGRPRSEGPWRWHSSPLDEADVTGRASG